MAEVPTAAGVLLRATVVDGRVTVAGVGIQRRVVMVAAAPRMAEADPTEVVVADMGGNWHGRADSASA